MRIRSEQAGDFPAVFRVNLEAFASVIEANLVNALREQAGEILSLVAEAYGDIVGHILFSPVTLVGGEDVHAVALAPMAVAPERQCRGIGTALVLAGLAECRARGIHAVFVVGHPGYYPRFGFSRASQCGIACEFEVPDEAFMVLELVPGSLSGKTGVVRFHDAFKTA